ncbi:MAG: MFS transporter [Ewingella americana]|jgi:MFS family permease|uniref:MFS transporter n=1 Tax=Ewingella americana TaxID=41202 RepID=UPI00242AC0BD|nr:MFS transporter [Ewingella americana]MCI1678661.1 MFS transporter [Ewingella americana]MCI1854248.1 MFS transporter [Ewingella americana]MCI1861548.1 MFS transporter [Ewingella americana]MCI2140894.1 MFS transporter [Ewingella americana]MCI2165161.1 MFS transporter [Ewingella americana]
MSNPYAEIFRRPGTKGFSAAGFIARLPLPMTTIGIVAMLSQTHGEYWLAGTVSATFAMANAFIAPQVSRWVDVKGQAKVLIPMVTLAFLALIGLCLAAWLSAPNEMLFMLALIAGVMPSIGSMVRARWTEIYRGKSQLHTAFAFESVLDELVYMAGPVFGIGLSIALFPEAGVLAAATFLAVGTLLFVVQKSTEPKVNPIKQKRTLSVMKHSAMWYVVMVFVGIGMIFGTVEVAVIAFAQELGNKGAATYILSTYAVGSCGIGLVFGAIKFKKPLANRLLIASVVAVLTTLPLPFVTSLWMMTLMVFVGGAISSPTFITGMTLIERIVPTTQITEGITYAMTGVLIGFSAGSAASGWAIDNFGASNGFWIAVAGGGVALLAMLTGYRLLAALSQRDTPENDLQLSHE